MSDTNAEQPVIIKKYANRRLYNTETSSYVTLEHLAEMIQSGRDFKVVDAKSGEDITRSVLTQIILEQETKGQTLLPQAFLRQLIGFYGRGMESLVPQYLESSMAAFAAQQDKLRDYFSGKMTPAATFAGFDEMARKNMAMFEQAARMLTGGLAQPNEPTMGEKPATQSKSEIESLKDQLAAMQAQLDRLSKSGKD
ncbi:MAG: polyhydroxyalkanoate synthesis repressor PhaR [Sphingomonadales bacterium]